QVLAREAKVSLPSIALHWLESRGAAPLFGASGPEQVSQVWDAWHERPPAALLERAEAIARGHAD
ncbi:MAG TPA: hypothetical protein VJS68_03875, partial [Thermoplasmata archaeon]|nr:hypothetical protein [Thermoplasmata archaeon]